MRIGWFVQQPMVFWPLEATNWYLESVVNLVTSLWKDVQATPGTSAAEFTRPVDPSEPRRNYRLHELP